jgi:membrane protease YdiL (CAAX protease family)
VIANAARPAAPALTQRSAWARAVGSVAALLVVNFGVTELLRLISNAAGWPTDVHSRAAVALGGAIVGEAVLIVLLIWWLGKQGLTLADLGMWKRPKLWALAAALTFALVYGVLTASNPGLRPYLGIHDLLKAEAIVAAIVAGTVEEVVCRGYFMFELQRSRAPVALQILGSGVVFGIAHFNYSFYGVVSAAVLGLVFALIYHFGKRSLAPAIAGHAFIDLIIEPALILWVLSGFPIPR